MHYVYILKSIKYPDKIYIGYTNGINQRIEAHNNGESIHTNKFKPWSLVSCTVFFDKNMAIAFG